MVLEWFEALPLTFLQALILVSIEDLYLTL